MNIRVNWNRSARITFDDNNPRTIVEIQNLFPENIVVKRIYDDGVTVNPNTFEQYKYYKVEVYIFK